MGVQSFKSISRAQDPGFKIRTAQVSTRLPGANPARVEMLVTDKLEKAIQEMPELDSIVSQSKVGISIVTVNIKDSYKDLRPIWDKLRRKVDAAQDDLPDEAMPSEVNDDFGDVFGIVVSLIAEGFDYADTKRVADQVRDELLRQSLVAKVDIHGAQEERIVIEYNNSRLTELGMSPSYISQFLGSKNIILSGGDVVTDKEIIAVEPSGDIESVQALRETYIPVPNGPGVLPLGDIAAIYRDYKDPPRSIVHTNGKPALNLAISMIEGGNVVELGKSVKSVLSNLQEEYPWGYTFEIVAFQPYLVTQTINSFVSNLFQAIAVVSVTMLLTLGLRTGMVVATLIPVTILGTLAAMSMFDIGLDQVSLAALMISLGMLVDNSIVMAESIVKRIEAGIDAFTAAMESATELKIPLLTSSLTTSAAFLPIFLAESTTGEYTAPIFKVVTLSLLISWFLSITMIPLFGYMFLRGADKSRAKSEPTPFFSRVEKTYSTALDVMLSNRAVTLTSVVAVFILSLGGFRFIPNIFFPPSEDPTFKIELELPVGTPIARTEKIVSEIEVFLATLKTTDERPGISNWSVFIGNGGPRYVLSHTAKSASPNYAFFMLNTDTSEAVDPLIVKIDEHIFENFPDASFSVKKLSSGAPVHHPIEVRVSGTDGDTLRSLSADIKNQLKKMAGVKGISDDWGRQTKKLAVTVDEAKAQTLGVSNSDIARALKSSLNGVQAADYREGDKIIPIILKAESVNAGGAYLPTSLNVFSQSTQSSVPVSQVTDINLGWESAIIYRRDRYKTLSVFADLEEGITASDINAQLGPWMEELSRDWDRDYSWTFGGEAETSGKANESIGEKLSIAAMIILLLLMFQFNCYRKTLIILLTIPLGLIGVVVGLLIGQSYMGFMTLLGIISLAGIVINNAIVLIDRIQIERDDAKLPLRQAIQMAAGRRLRPILLTTATTVLGMIPLWLGGGAMWEPMAISIIFGLLGATILTLGVVPVLYAVFFNKEFKEC
jgi:multidrug efflux pump subunit AcrB